MAEKDEKIITDPVSVRESCKLMELRCHVRKVDYLMIGGGTDSATADNVSASDKKKKKIKMHNVYTIDIY